MAQKPQRSSAALCRTALIGTVLAIAASSDCWVMAADGTPATFSLTERFGVSHVEQPVEFLYSGRPLEIAQTRMIGPDGREVAFQQLSNGNILVRTRLPKSLKSQTYLFWRYPEWEPNTQFTIDLPFASWPVAEGTPGRLQSPILPASVSTGCYFFKRVGDANSVHYQIHLRPDLASLVEFPADQGFSGYLNTSGWVVDPEDPAGDTLYAVSHDYQTGDPIRLTCDGRLPVPLQTGVVYFAIPVTDHRFRLAVTRDDAAAGRAIDLMDTGEGIFETVVEWTWRLETGKPVAPLPPHAVQITDNGGQLEIVNGLTGVRVVKTEGNSTSFNRAPIQAVRLADGTWSQDSPNYLYDPYPPGGVRQSTSPTTNTRGYELRVVESGPLMVRVEALYQMNRPEDLTGMAATLVEVDPEKDTLVFQGHLYNWDPWRQVSLTFRANGGTLPGGFQEKTFYWSVFNQYDPVLDQTTLQLSDQIGGPPVNVTGDFSGAPYLSETQLLAGAGFFKEIITVNAGQKSILIEDEGDSMVEYFINLYRAGVSVPDQARYRPHGVSDTSCGYELRDGEKTPFQSSASEADVYQDIDYSAEKDAGNCTCNANGYPCLMLWYPANSAWDTGWYWMFYDSKAAQTAPLVGFFEGRVSKLYRTLMAGPGLFSGPAHFSNGGQPAAGVHMHLKYRNHSLTTTQRTRREWGLYVSTKEDLRPVAGTQPIGPERHSLAAVNLTHLASYALDFPDPEGGWPPPYMEREAYNRLVKQLQEDEYARMDAHWSVRDLRDMWAGLYCDRPSGTCVGTTADVERIVSAVEQLVISWQERLVNRNGPFDAWYHGYQPGMLIMQAMPRVLAVLNFPQSTPTQRDRVKAAAAWLACVYWDNEYIPLDFDTGEGMGNPNQAVQLYQFRASNSLAYPSHPVMNSLRARSIGYAEGGLASYIHPDSGAPRGSCHYQIAGMDSVMTSFLLMRGYGVSMQNYPLWTKYGEFMLDALSPPDPRFGGSRKIVSVGDGATKGIAMLGMVAALIRESSPQTAAQLQWGWWSENSHIPEVPRLFEFQPVPSVLVIDEQAPQALPPMVSRHYEGYWSTLRSGSHTPYETGAWFTNGGWYADHRHDDGGQVSLYAHTAPLATDWNAHWWNPHTPGGYMHNRINREADLDRPWDADSPHLDIGTPQWVWPAQGQVAFSAFQHSSQSTASHGTGTGFLWTRQLRIMAEDPHFPVLLVADRFSGPGAGAGKVLTWNMWADGKVETPAGDYTPVERFNTTQSGEVNAYPSNGPVHGLGSGLQRFHFRGRTWPAHATSGIDWDLYLLPDGEQSFFIGNWGHNSVFGDEGIEFRAINGSEAYERQHILRVRGTGTFTTLFLPYRKGERPEDLAVTRDGEDFVVSWNGRLLRFDDNHSAYQLGMTRILTTYNATGASFEGLALSGGPGELTVQGSHATLALTGMAGQRRFSLPGQWVVPDSVATESPDVFVFDYDGQSSVELEMRAAPPERQAFYFPQVADGQVSSLNFRTTLVLVNTGRDTDIEVAFFGEGGQPMALDLPGLGAASTFHLPLAQGESIKLQTPGSGQLQVGYARISAGTGVSGTAVFSFSEGGRLLYESGVPATAPLNRFTLFSDSRQRLYSTGFALVNTGDHAAAVTLRLYDRRFHLLATRSVADLIPEFGSGVHLARYAWEVFDEIAAGTVEEGIVTVESDQPLAAVTLRQRDDPRKVFPDDVVTMAAFPVIPGIPEVGANNAGVAETVADNGTDAPKVIYFPQVGDGELAGMRLQTQWILLNLSELAGEVRLDFFDSAGVPMAIELGDLGRHESFTLQLGPGEALSAQSAGKGPLQVGYARVSSIVHLAGTAVFSFSQNEVVHFEAGVPAVSPGLGLTVFVDTSEGRHETGLAIANTTDQPASTTLRLYDSQARFVASRTMVLGARQHLARYASELFPEARNLQGSTGIIALEADKGLAAVTLRQTDDPAMPFPQDLYLLTVFPVIPGTPDAP